jgi:hypothetical protein
MNWCLDFHLLHGIYPDKVGNFAEITLNKLHKLHNSTVDIAWAIFRILADYRLRHLVNNAAIHIYAHDYIRMEITVLYPN